MLPPTWSLRRLLLLRLLLLLLLLQDELLHVHSLRLDKVVNMLSVRRSAAFQVLSLLPVSQLSVVNQMLSEKILRCHFICWTRYG